MNKAKPFLLYNNIKVKFFTFYILREAFEFFFCDLSSNYLLVEVKIETSCTYVILYIY